ncbi:MAG TPA: hypothetical protein VK964_19185 [Nocardioidaceae bacterium]|nr:hypothetical protein [Nocardioidaceae bacterium]
MTRPGTTPSSRTTLPCTILLQVRGGSSAPQSVRQPLGAHHLAQSHGERRENDAVVMPEAARQPVDREGTSTAMPMSRIFLPGSIGSPWPQVPGRHPPIGPDSRPRYRGDTG